MSSLEQPDQRPAGGSAPAHPGSADERGIIVSRVARFSPWVLGLLAAAPLAAAFGQNLDAGKSGAQIFSEVCSNCHRSPRELRSNASTSFLREHYTTGGDMASTMANYLSGTGSPPGAALPKRQPNATAPAATVQGRPPQGADPKASPQVAPALARGRPGSAQTTAEVKPPAAPPPTRPVLEEFEE
jgi:mono/diheme cytochrome c family protein